MSIAIKADGLSKVYQLGEIWQSQYGTLRDQITHFFSSFGKKSNEEKSPTTLWALRDVSFEVKSGEVIGVIGSNGAGKSTLLKILSRITRPTHGEARITGRVASLLEVGTGFHGELTGRENIFLNGAILGMGRAEIKKKFDAIVEFSEVARFIDTPVKRYSSGMYLKLAFAVAAHLDPDILIVDEVLAVGDAAFQRKCLGTMRDLTTQNRTVLFVSHNLQAVRTLCDRALLMDSGTLELDGNTDLVLNRYLKKVQSRQSISGTNLGNRLQRSTGAVRFEKVQSINHKNEHSWVVEAGNKATLQMEIESFKDVPSLAVCCTVQSAINGEPVTSIKKILSEKPISSGNRFQINMEFPNVLLRPGDYLLYLSLGDKNYDKVFDILDQNVDLPLLSVSSNEDDPHLRVGSFSLPASVGLKAS